MVQKSGCFRVTIRRLTGRDIGNNNKTSTIKHGIGVHGLSSSILRCICNLRYSSCRSDIGDELWDVLQSLFIHIYMTFTLESWHEEFKTVSLSLVLTKVFCFFNNVIYYHARTTFTRYTFMMVSHICALHLKRKY